MENGNVTAGYVVRLVGVMAIAVGAAWAFQTVGLGRESALAMLMWMIAAASAAGAGAGLVMASTAEQLRDRPTRL